MSEQYQLVLPNYLKNGLKKSEQTIEKSEQCPKTILPKHKFWRGRPIRKPEPPVDPEIMWNRLLRGRKFNQIKYLKNAPNRP